ncbi:hypothetical protein [Neptuniibacter halophilus]|uniref:hypothetical protein n=1 Tax=Neptuniibacter halophilus TaxID=651666 RepID=UPI002572925F|nr:hypothetical protein [Neptuniibacter halophilus]
MEKITENQIVNLAHKVMAECALEIPVSKWAHRFHDLQVVHMKAKYGEATATGIVRISSLFVGTSAWKKLEQTLRHEFAHLAVGTDQHHNSRFKQCQSRFRGDKPVPQSEIEEIASNNRYKWQVIAHLEDGTTFDVGGVHRKTKRYSAYHEQPECKKRDWLTTVNKRVVRYEFQPN